MDLFGFGGDFKVFFVFFSRFFFKYIYIYIFFYSFRFLDFSDYLEYFWIFLDLCSVTGDM